jgi:Tol biopolymer transport system component
MLLASAFLVGQENTDSKGKIAYVHQGVLWAKALSLARPTEIARDGENPQWSPSGQWLSYDIPRPAINSLVVRAMSKPDVSLNLQTQGEVHWSPTKDELGFVTAQGLMLIRPDKEGHRVEPQVLYPTQKPNVVFSFCWSLDGNRLAVLISGQGTPTLWNVDPATKHADQIPMDADVGSAKLAGWTSDEQRIVMWPNPEESESVAADGLPLVAVSLTAPGAESFLKEPVLRHPDFVSFSPKRPEILVTSGAYRDSWTNKQLLIVNPTSGKSSTLTNRKLAVASVAWSPDGESIAYSAGPDAGPVAGGNPAKAALSQRHLWIVKASGQQPRQLTSDSQYRDEYPTWSKDGRYVVFTRIDSQDTISVWGIESGGGTPTKLVDAVMGGVGRDVWFGFYGHIRWETYLAWSR